MTLYAVGGVAQAADLGDLEERIAELEQTTVRDAIRPLRISMYGQVDRAVLFWDDGFDSATYGVDNHTSSSRFGVVGRAAIAPGWSAGYRLEWEAAFPSSSEVFNGPGGDLGLSFGVPRIRQSHWEVVSKDLGRVAVGFQSPATDDITIINLGSQINDAAVHFNNAFRVRLDMATPFVVTDVTWGELAHNVDALRGTFVRYDTPILKGFMLSTAWNDDVWDVALRYHNGSGGFRVAGGVGYMQDNALRFDEAKGSASLLHEPTGLFVSVAGGWRDAAHAVPTAGDDAYFYYVQAGISARWFSPGKTTVYVDHGRYRNFNTGEILSINPDTGAKVAWGTLLDTEVVRWGFGVEQAFDAAGLLLYAQAHFYDPTLIGYPCGWEDPNVCGGDPSLGVAKLPAAAWQGFVVGARIQF